jgi:hypothetical protein
MFEGREDFTVKRSIESYSLTDITVTLMMEVILPSETSILKRATRRNIPEDDILHLFI